MSKEELEQLEILLNKVINSKSEVLLATRADAIRTRNAIITYHIRYCN